MKGHIIPQVYQKNWHTEKGESNVLYYDKNDLSKPINVDGGNVEKNLYEIDEYIINEQDKEYGLVCNDDYELEHYFDREYEDKWNDIVENSAITKLLENVEVQKGNCNMAIAQKDLVNTPFEAKLLKYVVIQFFRVYVNFKSVDKGLIDAICNFIVIPSYETNYKTKITEEEKRAVIGNENFMRSAWKQILLDCKDDNKTDSILSLIYEELKACNLTFIYLKNNISSRFILSDNPVIWNTGETKKYDKLPSGLFFPALPNLMVAYLKYPSESYIKAGDALCLFADDDFAKYMNGILLSQSIEKVGFMNSNINDNIDINIDFEKAWKHLFEH